MTDETETQDEFDRSFENMMLVEMRAAAGKTLSKLAHDYADMIVTQSLAAIMSEVMASMTQWGAQNDRAVGQEREMRLHRMINRLRVESAEAERKFAQMQEGEPQP